MSQRDKQKMVMPAQPTAGFIMVKTDFAFSFFKDEFNRPTQAADAQQSKQGDVGGGIAEVKLEFSRIVQITADQQPEFGAGQAVARLDHAQESEIANDGSFAALLE